MPVHEAQQSQHSTLELLLWYMQHGHSVELTHFTDAPNFPAHGLLFHLFRHNIEVRCCCKHHHFIAPLL